ncbi:MAG: hypothetical protein ACFB2Y_09685 [Fulvivirga sp.]
MKTLEALAIPELRQRLNAHRHLINSGTLFDFEKPNYEREIIEIECLIAKKEAEPKCTIADNLLEEVLELINSGLSSSEIAIAMNVSVSSANNYVSQAKRYAMQKDYENHKAKTQ